MAKRNFAHGRPTSGSNVLSEHDLSVAKVAASRRATFGPAAIRSANN
jgi:hypothetical protein